MLDKNIYRKPSQYLLYSDDYTGVRFIARKGFGAFGEDVTEKVTDGSILHVPMLLKKGILTTSRPINPENFAQKLQQGQERELELMEAADIEELEALRQKLQDAGLKFRGRMTLSRAKRLVSQNDL